MGKPSSGMGWGKEKPTAAHFCQAAALLSSVMVIPWQGMKNLGSCQPQVTILPALFAALSASLAFAEEQLERRREPEQCGLESRGQRKSRYLLKPVVSKKQNDP